jgi:hypothetical protein
MEEAPLLESSVGDEEAIGREAKPSSTEFEDVHGHD